MFRTIIAALVLIAPAAVAPAAACNGPVVTAVVVKGVQTAGALNHYELSGTVVNDGASQASNVLQSVDIFENGEKLDTRSVPPLKAGESFAFTYVADRSSDAGKGTSKIAFQLDPLPQGCDASSAFTLTF
jgi:hypothetical protein